jgi:hypothetical protein
MDQFPMIDDPENPGQKIRSFVIKSPKDAEDLFAQFYIKQIVSQAEAKKLAGN